MFKRIDAKCKVVDNFLFYFVLYMSSKETGQIVSTNHFGAHNNELFTLKKIRTREGSIIHFVYSLYLTVLFMCYLCVKKKRKLFTPMYSLKINLMYCIQFFRSNIKIDL